MTRYIISFQTLNWKINDFNQPFLVDLIFFLEKNAHVPLALPVPVTARNPRSFLRVRLQDGHSASGKFSIRIVPNQTPDKINELVKTHLENMWKLRESPNIMKVIPHHGGKPWMADPNHPHYVAGQKATEQVYGCKPDLTREGGSIPITLTFQVKFYSLTFHLIK